MNRSSIIRFAVTAALVIVPMSFAVAADSSSSSIQSCRGLLGTDFATCQWQNHNIYEQMAKKSAASKSSSSVSSISVSLASCRGMKGADLATCQWKNHTAQQDAVKKAQSSSVSSASSSSSSLTCLQMKGAQKTACLRDQRKAKKN